MYTVLESAKADWLRQRFIQAFVDTSTDYYVELAKTKPSNTAQTITAQRYLYDTLYQSKCTPISFAQAIKEIAKREYVYTMWDITPAQVIYPALPHYVSPKPRYLTLYQSDSVITWQTAALEELLTKEMGDYAATRYLYNTLPEDLYIFDDSFSFAVILTHSPTKENERLCLLCQ